MSEYFPATCPMCYARVMNVYAQAHSEWHDKLDHLLQPKISTDYGSIDRLIARARRVSEEASVAIRQHRITRQRAVEVLRRNGLVR